jgi:hypothetical protein
MRAPDTPLALLMIDWLADNGYTDRVVESSDDPDAFFNLVIPAAAKTIHGVFHRYGINDLPPVVAEQFGAYFTDCLMTAFEAAKEPGSTVMYRDKNGQWQEPPKSKSGRLN